MKEFFQLLSIYTAIGVTVLIFYPRRKRPPKEDEEVIKQQIMDKLDKLIKDVKNTIQ